MLNNGIKRVNYRGNVLIALSFINIDVSSVTNIVIVEKLRNLAKLMVALGGIVVRPELRPLCVSIFTRTKSLPIKLLKELANCIDVTNLYLPIPNFMAI